LCWSRSGASSKTNSSIRASGHSSFEAVTTGLASGSVTYTVKTSHWGLSYAKQPRVAGISAPLLQEKELDGTHVSRDSLCALSKCMQALAHLSSCEVAQRTVPTVERESRYSAVREYMVAQQNKACCSSDCPCLSTGRTATWFSVLPLADRCRREDAQVFDSSISITVTVTDSGNYRIRPCRYDSVCGKKPLQRRASATVTDMSKSLPVC
jgi:hypothetical protein